MVKLPAGVELDRGEVNVEVAETIEMAGSIRSKGARKILVVDDELHILKAMGRLFQGQAYELLTAQSGQEAMQLLEAHEFAVLISDQRMPGISGCDLLGHAYKHYPHTVRIMLTGNNDMVTAIEAINRGEVFRFLSKPWDPDQMLEMVDRAIEHHELLASRQHYEARIKAQNERLRRLNDELEDRVEERSAELLSKQEEIRQLYDELRQSFDATINALLCIMELGDIHVVNHCQRTAARVESFGEALGLAPERIVALQRAALLHWVGLINAPASLFEKRLEDFDAVERATWEFHPLLGQQAIHHVPALRRVGRIILHYVRRYDDPSFRPGESSEEGDEVLDEALIESCQILAICSDFERGQVPRSVMGEEDRQASRARGLKRVEAGSGGRFDPDLVRRFVEVVSREMVSSPSRVVSVPLEELVPGMVLARPLETAQGIPVAPRDMIITPELLRRLLRFRDSNGLNAVFVWQ